MLADHLGGHHAGIVVVLGDRGAEAGAGELPRQLEMVDRARSDRGTAVNVRVDGTHQDLVDAVGLLQHCFHSLPPFLHVSMSGTMF